MIVITEGQLTFTFPENARVTKYDDWTFYRNQFNSVCGGTKAVDLIYVSHRQLWLIEVKDYRRHRRTKVIDLADEIAFKVRDTLAGLVAAKCNANDDEQRAFAQRALKKNKIRIVLHLEQPQKHSKLFPKVISPVNLLQKLKQKLKAIDAHPCVVDKHSLKAEMNWHVE